MAKYENPRLFYSNPFKIKIKSVFYPNSASLELQVTWFWMEWRRLHMRKKAWNLATTYTGKDFDIFNSLFIGRKVFLL